MDINAVRQRLVEIESEVNIKGFVQAPSEISPTDLPVALHFVRNGSHADEGILINKEIRTVLLRVLVIPLGSGVSQEAESTVEPYLDIMIQLLLSRPSLTSSENPAPLENIQRMSLLSDSGVTVIPYPTEAMKYLGLEFTLQIEGQQNYILNPNE